MIVDRCPECQELPPAPGDLGIVIKLMAIAEVRHGVVKVFGELQALSLALVAILPAIGFMIAQQSLGLVPHWMVMLIVFVGSLPGAGLFVWYQRRLQQAFRSQREKVLTDV